MMIGKNSLMKTFFGGHSSSIDVTDLLTELLKKDSKTVIKDGTEVYYPVVFYHQN